MIFDSKNKKGVPDVGINRQQRLFGCAFSAFLAHYGKTRRAASTDGFRRQATGAKAASPGTSMLITQSPLFLRHLSRNTLKKIPKEKYHAERISTSVNSWGIIAAPSSLGEGLSNRSTAMKLQGDTEKHFGDCGTIHNTFARLLCCHRLPQK